MPDQNTKTHAICGCLEVFSTPKSGKTFGYRLTGAGAGPQLVVIGHGAAAETVFERLLSIPTLPWMRGALVLLQLDALDDPGRDLDALAHIGTVDRTLALENGVTDDLTRQNYHMVLRVCTQLGMIAGRGVPETSEPIPLASADATVNALLFDRELRT